MIVHSPITRPSRLALPSLRGLSGDALVTALGTRLDDAVHYLPRVGPGAPEPIDAVIVGRGGTFAITRLEERGRFRHRNGHWYRWNRSTESWVPWDAVGIDAARLAARRLSLYLERAALPSSVEPIAVAGRGTSFELDPEDRTRASVHSLDEPDQIAARMAGDEVLSDAQVDRIVALLDPRQPLPRLAPLAPR